MAPNSMVPNSMAPADRGTVQHSTVMAMRGRATLRQREDKSSCVPLRHSGVLLRTEKLGNRIEKTRDERIGKAKQPKHCHPCS